MDRSVDPDRNPEWSREGEPPAEPAHWTMPEWMEPYRDLIVNTGGNEVEELINDLNTDRRMMRTNVVRFSLAVAVRSQVSLLAGLREAGLLRRESQ
ncbi:hypothetical protein [Micromonospora sp. NPDC047730]|uniref:hypothetical protein n=1 Tax=Micromonospora sp. NPDC047730 TaxID=3364253 RepID=UPI003722BDEF